MGINRRMELMAAFRKGLCKTLGAALCAALCFLSGSCSGGRGVGQVRLRVLSWNVQTFFDARNDGTEYRDFAASRAWGEAAYTERLRRLCAALRKLDADVLVLEEVENRLVLHDISNFLAGDWNLRRQYGYGCFAKLPGSAIGCAVLSRYPLEGLSVHALDVRPRGRLMPSLRPVMRVDVCRKGARLCLLVNHWKSKSGGAAASAVWRGWQEQVLAERLSAAVDSGEPVLACGDFNQDVAEFSSDGAGTVLLRRLWAREDGEGAPRAVAVGSPWYGGDGTLVEPGSYCFRGQWSRIDDFFAAGGARIAAFAPQVRGFWCDAETYEPRRYQVWNGSGCSDHLPILCEVVF